MTKPKNTFKTREYRRGYSIYTVVYDEHAHNHGRVVLYITTEVEDYLDFDEIVFDTVTAAIMHFA